MSCIIAVFKNGSMQRMEMFVFKLNKKTNISMHHILPFLKFEYAALGNVCFMLN